MLHSGDEGAIVASVASADLEYVRVEVRRNTVAIRGEKYPTAVRRKFHTVDAVVAVPRKPFEIAAIGVHDEDISIVPRPPSHAVRTVPVRACERNLQAIWRDRKGS
jgi:hypothetical protein